MRLEQLFPTLLIALDVSAAAVCGCAGDWRKLVYWLAAATLTAVVTF